MSLHEFLGEGPSTTSWADDDVALPSAPMATAAAPTRTSVLDAPDRKDLPAGRREYDAPREARGPVDFPTEPPFTAYVGNLSYNADDAMLREFFSGVQSVRLVRDRETDKLKGFGYVQFDTLDALKEAVGKDGSEMSGRQLRINVSESRAAPAGGHEDRTGGATNWRRADALPVETSPFGSRSSSGFGRTASTGRGEAREPREPREPLPPSAAEKVSDWRMHKEPIVPEPQSPPQAAALPPKRSGFSDRFSRSSSGAGPDSGDEPKAWRREGDSATPPAIERQPSAPRERRDRREPREYQPARDRSASREPTRAPRQPTVSEQANTWRAARPPPAADKPVEAPVAEPEPAEPEVVEPVAAEPEAVVEPAVEEEGWSQVEKPAAPRRVVNPPAGRGTGRGSFDRNRSGSGRHRESAETNGDAEKQSPRTSERRTGFFTNRDVAAESGSWRR
ncbi:Eukaryotic translation initiation factor 4B [Coemansia linderi]|uniref:Eukaryotic translation initiation factor 4B n=1 Tax=Coemansia linderi TaxID=2663919 RepID=A0ACC1KQ08_9FUNG|nr:Eukaryotic translation initiation factor 4B [Coemansia linderi]